MLLQAFEMDAWRDGIQQGKSLGLAEGSRQKAFETARILKQLGDPIQKIVQATGLTVREVETLTSDDTTGTHSDLFKK